MEAPTQETPFEVESVSVLQLRPNDILVIKTKQQSTMKQVEDTKRMFHQLLGDRGLESVAVVVLSQAELEIIRKDSG